MSFPITSNDGNWHDDALKQQFRLALLRTDQQWDQRQARRDTQRHLSRRDAFQRCLDTLLEGEAYRHVDAATKERLLAEVTALAFPPKGHGL